MASAEGAKCKPDSRIVDSLDFKAELSMNLLHQFLNGLGMQYSQSSTVLSLSHDD
jgi:hypothetical protein